MMKKLMGKNGIDIWKKANGIDTTPVTPYSEQKSISTETTFDQDTIDVTRMHEILIAMIEKIAFNMRKKGKLTGCITVKIRYSNFDTHTLQKTISYTSFDHILTKTAIELFDRLYTRRMLIRLIGVRFSHLVNGVQQLSMFENTPEMINLYQTLDRIRKRFGEKAIFKATAL
jgi:DNA polymerase-4